MLLAREYSGISPSFLFCYRWSCFETGPEVCSAKLHSKEFTIYLGLRGRRVPVCKRYIDRRRFKCDGTRAETNFRLSAKSTTPFKSARASVQSTTSSRGVRISGSNAGYTMFRGSVKSTGYPLRSPVSPSLPLPWVTVCHHISAELYQFIYNIHTLGGCGPLDSCQVYNCVCRAEGFGLVLAEVCDHMATLLPVNKNIL